MSEILIHKKQDNKICYLELNLPEKRNILSLNLIKSLTRHLEDLTRDPDIHFLVLSGKGGHFCAGGDLRWMSLDPDSSDTENTHQVQVLSKMFYTLQKFPLPIIGKIEGSVFGGGLGLLSLCDIAVAHKDTKFCFSELKLALIPSLIAPFVLEKIPHSQARELILSARIFETEEALKLGLIHFSGDSTECQTYMHKLTQQLLTYDKNALKSAKTLLNTIVQLSAEEAKDYTVQALVERRKNPVVVKNIQKFLRLKTLNNKS